MADKKITDFSAGVNVQAGNTQFEGVQAGVNVKLTDTLVRGYKEYTCLMSQTGTSAPTVKVLKNDLSAAIVWTRGSAGNYVGTLAAAFVVDKTLLPPDVFQQYTGTDFQNISITRTSANAVLVNTTIGANGAGVASDGVIVTDFPITIKVYN
jgi:hypothetical protein